MGCCGKNRPVQWVENDIRSHVLSTSRTASVQHFEYVGETSLTAVGPVTSRRYRFDHPGAQLPVDARDAPSMAGVPNLRKVPSPE